MMVDAGTSTVSEAEDRYLAEVGHDCEAVLGRGIELLELESEKLDGAIRLVARYRLHDRPWESDATGENLIAAHAALRAQLLIDRIRLGFTEFVDRR
jgi:hypothetical protein